MADTELPYRQSLDNCFSDKIGEGGLSAASFDAALVEAGNALDWLRSVHESGELPLLRVPARTDDLARIEEVAEKLLDDTTDIFVFGIGGSALGAQALAQAQGQTLARALAQAWRRRGRRRKRSCWRKRRRGRGRWRRNKR